MSVSHKSRNSHRRNVSTAPTLANTMPMPHDRRSSTIVSTPAACVRIAGVLFRVEEVQQVIGGKLAHDLSRLLNYVSAQHSGGIVTQVGHRSDAPPALSQL